MAPTPSRGLLPSSPDQAARRLLGESLRVGRRLLGLAAASSTVVTAATASGFFAIAAIAQDALSRHRSWQSDKEWFVLLVMAAIVRAGGTWLSTRLAVEGSVKVENELRGRLLQAAVSPGAATPSAELATVVMDEVEKVGRYAEHYEPARLTTVAAPLLLLAAAFPLNWVVGVLLVLCAPLPAVNLSIVGIGTSTAARRHTEQLRFLSGYFLDRLRGLATLRDLAADQAEVVRVDRASQRLADTAMSVLRVALVAAGVLEAVVTVAIAVLATYIGLTLLGYVDVLGLPAHMSLRTGLFLLMITPLYFQPVRALAAAYHERGDALAAIESLSSRLERPSRPQTTSHRTPLDCPPHIRVRNLTATFPGREVPALDLVSLDVEAGELLGVTGASGAGKSTLLRVLSGDFGPSGGSVIIDGLVPNEIERSSIAWLGQRPYFFPGSLAENISLGRTDPDDPAVIRAAFASGLEPLLVRLPRGIHTPIGEGGWGLSGGEAHRVAVARAMLRPVPVLLLDEPTAHLDAVTEESVIGAICGVASNATTVLVSHSSALLSVCDRVLTLDRGRLSGDALPVALDGR
jgi:ATP-binding cassette, subfamily C, bacterial CydD